MSLPVQPLVDFIPPSRVLAPPRLTERYPALFPLAVRVHRARRRLAWMRSTTPWSRRRSDVPLDFRVKKHNSLLLRQLGDSDMQLQHNKVTNLRLASDRMDGLLIRPGETFSFNKVVGNCTRRKGYLEGMRLSNGAAHAGVGSGICQLANLLHWMFLHSPLTIVERSEHSFDPFPDNERVLPWGVGCSIVYNYVDLVVRNDTAVTFQILVRVGERYLEGELRADQPTDVSYRVFGQNEHFMRHNWEYFRSNEIWRTVIDKRTGDALRSEHVKSNCAKVMYTPTGVPVVDVLDRV